MNRDRNARTERRRQLNKQLLKEYQNGDPVALGELVKINRGLAGFVARRYYWAVEVYPDIDKQDILQCCLTGLFVAILEWNPERGQLGSIAANHMSNEIRRLIWKRESLRNDGYSVTESYLQEPFTAADENFNLEDVTADHRAINPAEAVETVTGCNEFFKYLEEHHDIRPEDLEQLKAYVYYDWPPKDTGVFTRIKNELRRNKESRGFINQWLDDRTGFYKSPQFNQTGGKHAGYSDPTLNTVIKREQLEERLTRLLNKAVGV